MGDPVIDVHIHFGVPDDPASGGFWSEEFARSPAYYAMLLITRSLFKRVDYGKIKEVMFAVLDDSKYTEKAVFLALDKVYDKDGNPHDEKTHLYVPNSCIIRLAGENDKVLFGASVHPYRPDWEEELNSCLAKGAVLCKWIPSTQLINPENDRCLPLYHKLALHDLPLLCHCGPEYAIPTSDPIYAVYNNPKYLRTALDMGVTVIIAHCATPYWGSLDVDYQDDFEEFLKLFREADAKGWKLYADLSAVCTPFRSPYIEKVIDAIPSSRLLYGSDYPIPISDVCFKKSKKFLFWLSSLAKTLFMKNLLDKNYMLIKEMGFDDCVYSNAAKLFNAIRYT